MLLNIFKERCSIWFSTFLFLNGRPFDHPLSPRFFGVSECKGKALSLNFQIFGELFFSIFIQNLAFRISLEPKSDCKDNNKKHKVPNLFLRFFHLLQNHALRGILFLKADAKISTFELNFQIFLTLFS